ncbi:MAG: accessory Sec system translocase SecA2 [Herbiconiux sp.]|uniref:accessory Sec system translocase SecA2 n=1 Tax=Herbiconiux sp. TaxID=1871186 RepID=UPI0012102B4D|nr:accessory Sec system translocase SecA2 [Herbiconiux sp.]TAJ46072.1 MAG: accessory Sec system translocase SecA2 [Herbiconiux sp.]
MVQRARGRMLRQFLGIGGVAEFRLERRVVASAELTRPAAAPRPGALAALRSSGTRGWSAEQEREFCARAAAAAEEAVGLRAYPGQLVAALALLHGHGVQMATGEGKTLAGALAAIAGALQGRSVHVLSVNDYLARRDAEWMAPLYSAFGISVGWVSAELDRDERRSAYLCEVTYVSVSEVAFDVLRDRFRTDPADDAIVERDVALVDEVDAVLIDEATTPLVLAGEASPDQDDGLAADIDPRVVAAAVAELHDGTDFEVDSDRRNVSLTDAGTARIEQSLGLTNLFASDHDHLTAVNLALHARTLVQRDVDYLVRDGALEVVNTARGRIAAAQRWPDGLHAAIEAKEGLGTSVLSEVLDSITVRALIRGYASVCGMSGTAMDVAELLAESYGFTTGEVDPRVPSVRDDLPDRVFRTRDEKQRALVEHVVVVARTGRPVLIGTGSVAASETLATALAEAGVATVVLNAKNDAEEAEIIARAGEFGRVTISTQMAGRGTDIRLGGVDEHDRERILGLGGLYVIGAERQSSSRLDGQLRGRAGRQGDPGSTVFFASLDDDVIVANLDVAEKEGGDAIRADAALFDHAQRVAEATREQLRTSTLHYSEIPARQREAVLRLREGVFHGEVPEGLTSDESAAGLAVLELQFGTEAVVEFRRELVLHHLDAEWSRHAAVLAAAREGIHLRSLARDDPLAVYDKIAYSEFEQFVPRVSAAVAEAVASARAAGRVDAGLAALRRPSSTWTYMVVDDPFGSPERRLARRITRGLRRLVG